MKKGTFLSSAVSLMMLLGCGEGDLSNIGDINGFEPTAQTQDQIKKAQDIEDVSSGQKKESEVSEVTMLVVVEAYEDDVQNRKSLTHILHYVDVTNTVLEQSGLNVRLTIGGTHTMRFEAQDAKEALLEVSNDEEVHAVRDLFKADIVVSFAKYGGDGRCGIAYINKTLSEKLAYAHVVLGCPATTLAHEIGHVMGLAHSSKRPQEEGFEAYARGYGIDGEFTTVMAYGSDYATDKKMLNYSSPQIECEGYECGVLKEMEEGADAVSALTVSFPIAEKFR